MNESHVSIVFRYLPPLLVALFVQAYFMRKAGGSLRLRRWLTVYGTTFLTVMVGAPFVYLLSPRPFSSSFLLIAIMSALFWGAFVTLLCVILAIGGDSRFSRALKRYLGWTACLE
jgi:hypothetical protein